MDTFDGCVIEATEDFFKTLREQFPEYRQRLRYELSAANGLIYTFFKKAVPQTMVEKVNPDFFRRFNVPFNSWQPVFRSNGDDDWHELPENEEERAKLPAVDFGWRFHKSFIRDSSAEPNNVEEYVKTDEKSQGVISILTPLVPPTKSQTDDKPAFLRKIMD